MVLGGEVVVDLPVGAEVVQRVDVRSSVRVHEDHVARVADVPVAASPAPLRLSTTVPGRVAHEDLVAGVTGRLEAGHADEVVDAQVVDTEPSTARMIDAIAPA